MKKKLNIKPILITGTHIIVICHMLFFTLLAIVITPYQDWAWELMYVDQDKLIVLKLFCVFELLVNAALAAGARLYSKIFFVIHIVLAQLYIVYFCWLAGI